jgi:NCS2 family nucleobase:cation symporter-2
VDEWPPTARLALLGLQYAVMDALYLVLVAIVLRSTDLSPADRVSMMGMACVGAAIGTALQALPRGPVGSGFLAPPVYSAIFLAPSVMAAKIGGMPLVFGMTIFAGIVEVAVGLLLLRLRFVVTPVLSGLTVFIVGLQLGIIAIGQTLDVRHQAFAGFPVHLAVACGTLLTCVSLSIWGRGGFKLLGTLVGLIVGMTGAYAAGLLPIDRMAEFATASWVAIPVPLGRYDFDVGLAPAFFAAGVAAALRAVGVVTTCQRANDAAWRRPDMTNARRGVLADGLANIIGGGIGTPGMNVAPSLVGISTATGATSRVIAFAAAAILLVFAVSPKLSGFFLLVQSEVAGGLLVFTSCFMISGGMEIMLAKRPDGRAVYVIGISTLLSLGRTLFPRYFDDLSPALRGVTDSSLALGLTAALVLTLLFRLGTVQRARIAWNTRAATIDATKTFLADQGQHWKIPKESLDAAVRQVGEVLGYFVRTHQGGLDGELQAAYDGLQLRIDLVHWGRAGTPPPMPEAPLAARDDLDNEEAAAVLGLRHFVHGLMAERTQLKVRRGRVMVRLVYSA